MGGPTSVITFLGIIIDTDKRELHLPTEKLQRLIDEVQLRLKKRSCTHRELESLIGALQHVCEVIVPGRSFLRRAIALLSVARKKHHPIHLNEVRDDLAWWSVFAAQWNGASLVANEESPQLIATVIWGRQWRGSRVQAHSATIARL